MQRGDGGFFLQYYPKAERVKYVDFLLTVMFLLELND
jgi:hypothetical protein